ncbi:MAG: hypothetical protein IKZ59_06745 [Clostridia bacterium]|nr:hypothetical protein [Clostridia bacterium]
MFIALNNAKTKISIEEALPSENYFCPVCGNPVIVKAAKSENIRTHFAHKRNNLCIDNWKHDMSEWHYEWQSKFPIENREVVVENNGIVHRADILINSTVIEFQHSPISGEEFESRNKFYKKCGYRVVWLFDATDQMKIDDCDYLVWKRKTTRFSNMITPIDAVFIQHYLPEKDDLLLITRLDPKNVFFYNTVFPIMPENFLKEYSYIEDKNVLSIQSIIEKTETKKRTERLITEAKQRYMVFSRSKPLLSRNFRRRRF